MTTAASPEALEAVRELERSLDVAEEGRTLAEQRLADARRDAEALLESARRRGAAAAERARTEALAAAERESQALDAATDAQIAAIESRLASERDFLLRELRAIVLPAARAEAEA